MAIKVEMNDAGAKELLKSAQIMGILETRAAGVVARAGGKAKTKAKKGKNRGWVEVEEVIKPHKCGQTGEMVIRCKHPNCSAEKRDDNALLRALH